MSTSNPLERKAKKIKKKNEIKKLKKTTNQSQPNDLTYANESEFTDYPLGEEWFDDPEFEFFEELANFSDNAEEYESNMVVVHEKNGKTQLTSTQKVIVKIDKTTKNKKP